MSLRVHDLAAEFGIASDELIKLLREMDIFVRSHLSALEEDKVARVRTRWEREKRKEKQPAPAKGRRRAPAKAKAPEAPAPKAAEEPRQKRRRRTAAEVAAQEAEAAAAAAAEAAAREPEVGALFAAAEETAEEPALHVSELFPPELAPPESAEEEEEAEDRPIFMPAATEAAPPSAAVPPLAPVASAAPAGAAPPSAPPRVPHIPTPVGRPISARPKPVASAVPGAGAPPPRPVASAAPGGVIEDRRRDKKKRKKGKKWTVDQEAVAENVARTLATIRGPARKGVRRRDDEPSFRELEAARVAEEKEKEKTRVRVNEFISVAELAEILKVPASQIVAFAFKELGMMVTVNQRLDFDQIEL
ncbi:MAG TPA: translation initiation factor IF-2 N-terminal domain-containing protein, partial [Gemmatimonadales bacterium]|nr:translation initiation factor IF-2 N-terminal domain-containing protein [Gemmatimonadales bacterium]